LDFNAVELGAETPTPAATQLFAFFKRSSPEDAIAGRSQA
jgi:hypothetical protein